MSCLICAGPAERIICEGNWEERVCSSCGHYKISDALVLTLMEQGQIFDVRNMRIWLADRRRNGSIPRVEVHEPLLRP